MAQYIRTPFDMSFDNIQQVSQVSYHDGRVIEINYDTNSNCVVVQNNGEWFWLSSPDIDAITMRHVFEYLGIANDQIALTWPDDRQINNILDCPIQQTPLNQMTIYTPQITNSSGSQCYIPSCCCRRTRRRP